MHQPAEIAHAIAQTDTDTATGTATLPPARAVDARSGDTGLPAWMAIARAESGVRTGPPGLSNARITAYHAGTNIAGYDDQAAWCSSFVNWCLARVGLAGTGSALARSWLDWGQALAAPRPGCIVVLTRDAARPWTGHVGFFLRTDGADVLLLGGNQLDCVCENSYPASSLLGYRWPIPTPAPNPTCPLCGGPNGCSPAACGSFDVACWCREARFSPALLARVPAADRGRACVCATCAAAAD